jgi:hypothetical protein
LQKHGNNATTLPALDELGVGALAGACSKFFTTPISNIVTRKQTASMISARSKSQYFEPSVKDIVGQIRSEKGFQGFWSGYSASLVLTLNPSLTFFLYETFKRTLIPRSKRDDPGAAMTFLMAAVSKAIASTITYPFSLAKAQSQAGSRAPVNADDAATIRDDVSSTLANDEASLGQKKQESEQVGRDIKTTAKRSTVFSTILHIYNTEGPSALYQGVLGEISKGFFSHGTTMIVKEAVHKVIIQLYFLVLKTLKRFPEKAGEVAGDAQDKAGHVVEGVNGAVGSLFEGVKLSTGSLLKNAQEIGNSTTAAARTGGDYAKSQAGDLLERAQVVGSNTTEVAKSGSDYLKSQAGSILGSAQEQVGKTMEDIGKSIRVGKPEGSSE